MKTLLSTLLLGLAMHVAMAAPASANWYLQQDAGFSKPLSPSMPHVHRIGPRDAISCAKAALQARMHELIEAGNTGRVRSDVIAGGRRWDWIGIDGFSSQHLPGRLITPDIRHSSTRC
ncbi:MAG: hypothetical protein ACK4F5_11555 [Aliihoeflea sp.]